MVRWRPKSVERAIADIREFHRVGRQSREDFRGQLPHGGSKKVARSAGMNLDQYEKSRFFAREYTIDEMEDLCDRISNGGFPVGVSHLIRLFWLPQDRRERFLLKTIQEKWSCRRLGAAIQQAKRKPRRHSGRPPTVRDRAEAIRKFSILCEQWKRLSLAIRRAGVTLPPKLRLPMRRRDSTLKKFYELLQRYRKM
jgi:hypothetical protein